MDDFLTRLYSLAGKRALVTGGAKGLGAMIATALLKAGCEVWITSRSSDGERLAQELSATGTCRFLHCDLSSPAAIRELGSRLKAQVPKLDILVNNAGQFGGGEIGSITPEHWDEMMAVNVRAPFLLVQQFMPLLESAASAEDPARIVNIGSIGGYGPQSNSAHAYGSSKAALHQLTRMLASDLTGKSITANAIVPGYFPTDMTAGFFTATPGLKEAVVEQIPAHRLGTPEDIGGLVIFLCSRAGAYLSGSLIPLEGGLLSA